jgi:hypothetical protein
MDIHEYQAKELLSGFGVAVPPGGVAYSPEQAVYVATELGGWHWAIKAQIHAGGRGKAGGVKLCRTYQEVATAAKGMLGAALVTNQTGPAGKVVHRLYVEKAEPYVRACTWASSSTEGSNASASLPRRKAASRSRRSRSAVLKAFCRSRSIRRWGCRASRPASSHSDSDSTSNR